MELDEPTMELEENILSNIFNKRIEDIDESIVDELMQYSELLQAKDLKFLQTAVENIEDFNITWERPWYQMANFVQSEIYKGKYKVESGEETYKREPFKSEESELMVKNWKKLRKKFNLPDQPASLFRCKIGEKLKKTDINKAKIFMVSFLAKGLKRTLYQVFKRGITDFVHVSQGGYSPLEEKIILTFVTNFNNEKISPVQELSRVLSRHPRHIYVKIKQLQNGKKIVKRSNWNLKKATELLRCILKYSKLSVEQLKNRTIDKSVWNCVAEEMQASSRSLSKIWYTKIHVQLFVNQKILLRKILKKLFLILKFSPYKKWSDIDWQEVAKNFPDGCTWYFIYYATKGFMASTLAHKYMSVAEAAEMFLEDKFYLVKRKRLKRVKYNENGQLEHILEND